MKKIGILIFIIAIVGGIVLAKMFSFGSMPSVNLPSVSFFSGLKGSGKVVSQTRDVSQFNGINAGGVFLINVKAGQDFKVSVSADDNLLPYISTRVENGILRIETEKRFSTHNRIKVDISAPKINKIDLSGASKLTLDGVSNDSLAVKASGACKATISGTTGELSIEMSGASNLDAGGLESGNVTIDGSGASNAYVKASEKLKADLSGASNVRYSGNPSEVIKDTSGAASVKQR